MTNKLIKNTKAKIAKKQKTINTEMQEELAKLVSLAENLEKKQSEISIQEKVINKFLDTIFRIYTKEKYNLSDKCIEILEKHFAPKREKQRQAVIKAQETKKRKKLLAQNNVETN